MKFFLVDTDQLDKTAEATFQNAVTKIPTFQIWKNGEKTDEIVGYSKDKLKSLVAATFPKQKAPRGRARPVFPGFFFIFSKNKKRDT